MSIDKMTLDLVGEYVKQNNVKVLEAAGTPAVSAEEGNAIVEKVDGIYSKDFSTDIANLESRSVINKSMRFLTLRNSTTQSLTVNTIIKFDTIVDSFGNLEYNTTNNTIKLKKGSIWDIRVSIIASTTGYTYFQIVNASTGAPISQLFSTISPNYNASENSKSYISKLYKCEEDIDICVKVIKIGTTPQSLSYISADNSYSTFEVVETAMSYSLDPVVYAQDHEINYYEFGMTANYNVTATNNGGNNIPITKVISGDLPVNADGTITIPANKKYKVTLVNSILTGYSVLDIKQDNVIIGGSGSSINYGNNNTNITSSTVFAYTKLKNTDSKLALYSVTSLTSTIMYYFFRVILEEIKNPVIVEYNNINEISNPLTSSDISQESPIGTVIEYVGNSNPDHYLACDGKIYNISDYPELFNKIENKFGGNGTTTFAVPNYSGDLKDVTPTMTSNTTPTPYVASASNLYNGSYAIWRAFDNTLTGTYDAWACNGANGWIKLDFGEEQSITAFSITSRNQNTNTDVPKNFILYGSNDDVDYIPLSTITDETNWTTMETRMYNLGDKRKYRYYKLEVTANNGASWTAIGLLKFYNSEKVISYIKSEATHYAVNQYGGFQEDILFEGNVSTNNTVCTLSYDYREYDNIWIQCAYNGVSNLIPVKVDSIDSNTIVGLQVLSINSVDVTGRGTFPTRTSFKLVNSAGNIAITKIIGIKGSIPTYIEGGVL